ncbi:hypothetical protein SEA_BANTAM_38 [Gordonia phage Bantam]|uniref:Uncharacterized protein n=1 Tax=Gordonia phage Bantam TaxID=1887641 RepID=A0A1B3AYA5_9CAUD|nr:hypothetical protein BIZ77_gp140 [Gordonia phage Bantam]AOE43728.1 hypothetical protein SEA_BANTAM_38 [Gordonia phage Bantam]
MESVQFTFDSLPGVTFTATRGGDNGDQWIDIVFHSDADGEFLGQVGTTGPGLQPNQ